MLSRWHKKYRSDRMIALLIAMLPFALYIHLLFSNNTNSLEVFGIDFPHVYSSNNVFIWFLLKNIVPTCLLLTWFFTVTWNWKYLLIPFTILYLNKSLDELDDTLIMYFPNIFNNELYTMIFILMMDLCFIIVIVMLDNKYFKYYRKRKIEFSIKSILRSNSKYSNKIYRENLKYLNGNKSKMNWTKYLQKIFNVKLAIENRLSIYGGSKNNSFRPQRDHLNLVVISILIFSIILWFVHYFVPENTQKLDLGIIQVYNNGFLNVRIFIWFLVQKLIILIPMIIWFLSCQHWWKYAILSPIILYSYQFWEATQDVESLDAAGNINAFPAIFCVVLVLLALSKAIKYRVEILTMYEYLLEEIDDLMNNPDFIANKGLYKKLRRYIELKEEIAKETNTKKQLMRLISLREELLKHLQINYLLSLVV
ncbi:hypothetical protein [uncultured Eudoraea sp.]|uniref:hypothetical protein n=1 Tax=uncultured Eudoraea sp. TaxID=1035614 RepID=UPI00260C9D39|nr:hypothetical protein [uncultured Eudoraea sp.]